MSDWGPFSLHGKSAVVTGGAMGIGLGIVKRLAEAGANVLIADLDFDCAVTEAAALKAAGVKAACLKLDVTAPDAGASIVAAMVENFGGVDILVNNAGIYPQVLMLQMEPTVFDKVLAINLKATAFIAKAVGQKMVDQGKGGKIVNIASIDGIHPSMVGLAAYDASKGGVVMFTKNFALEMGQYGVNVNAIAPGSIATPGTAAPLAGSGNRTGVMTEDEIADMMAGYTARIPVGRMGEPDDIGKVAAFLASSAADYMTGDVVVVDGGYLLS